MGDSGETLLILMSGMSASTRSGFHRLFFFDHGHLLPYVLGASRPIGLALPASPLLRHARLFRLLSLVGYYHGVRRWGFLSLYKAKHVTTLTLEPRVWCSHLSLYLPSSVHASPFSLRPRLHDIGLMTPIIVEWSAATLLYPACALYLAVPVLLGFPDQAVRDGSP